MDAGGICAIAQADVAAFYDRISPMRVAVWLREKGCPAWLVAAIVMLQLNCTVVFKVGECERALRQMCSGSLTGSSVAGVCGWAIVADCMASASP